MLSIWRRRLFFKLWLNLYHKHKNWWPKGNK